MRKPIAIINGKINIIGLNCPPGWPPPRNIIATIANMAAIITTGISTRSKGIGPGLAAGGTCSALSCPVGNGGTGSLSAVVKGTTT
ncbi:hypothetical protein [Corynebacterium sp. A21]|uniref:hypothetical protein n=1 Tax=Corynebacterium sp. A21 TaxID=3457318 RepID=UPI003FD6100F